VIWKERLNSVCINAVGCILTIFGKCKLYSIESTVQFSLYPLTDGSGTFDHVFNCQMYNTATYGACRFPHSAVSNATKSSICSVRAPEPMMVFPTASMNVRRTAKSSSVASRGNQRKAFDCRSARMLTPRTASRAASLSMPWRLLSSLRIAGRVEFSFSRVRIPCDVAAGRHK
jgi:hypothetical protein